MDPIRMLTNELRAMEVRVGLVQTGSEGREDPHKIGDDCWRASITVRGFGGKHIRHVVQLRKNEDGRMVTERWTENN